MTPSDLKGIIKTGYNLKHLTWFKVGGNAEIFFQPYDIYDLIQFIKDNNELKPITVIGAGSNLIIRDGGIEGVVIKLGKNFTGIELNENSEISVGAGCLNFSLAKFCLANSIPGFEFLIGIPGTIGGGIAMNAGAYGREFKDIVKSVEAIDSKGNILNFTLGDIGFSYRSNTLPQNLIFTKVFFSYNISINSAEIKKKMDEISIQRRITQPITKKTGGSTFSNPKGYKAWKLIEQAGMRGARVGQAEISELHCNFMINLGEASAQDLENLGQLVIKKVKENSNVELIWEVKRLGRKSNTQS